MKSEKIFVYGTLLGAFNNPMAKLLRIHADFVGKGTLKGWMYCETNWHFPYPVAFWSEESGALIFGEVYAFKKEMSLREALVALDAYEGISEEFPKTQEYIRTVVPVTIARGEVIRCWAYVAAAPVQNLPLIAHGDFLRYIGKES
jgi:gamma-glutamylcyclotransferase (GGCT)/AIG2-like uncharacterized protein YtfP